MEIVGAALPMLVDAQTRYHESVGEIGCGTRENAQPWQCQGRCHPTHDHDLAKPERQGDAPHGRRRGVSGTSDQGARTVVSSPEDFALPGIKQRNDRLGSGCTRCGRHGF
jgi:hypothetical protein